MLNKQFKSYAVATESGESFSGGKFHNYSDTLVNQWKSSNAPSTLWSLSECLTG